MSGALHRPWSAPGAPCVVVERSSGSCLQRRGLAGSSLRGVSSRRYSTVYTMFPVFSLVLDKDVESEVAMLYPELYKDLLKVPAPFPPPFPPSLLLL